MTCEQSRGSERPRQLPFCLAVACLIASGVASHAPVLKAQAKVQEVRLTEALARTDPLALELHRVRGAVIAGRTVFIADAGNQRVVAIDLNGRVEGTFGRAGSGPGEFRSINLIEQRAETISVYDIVQARLTHFDRQGRVLRSEVLPTFEERPTTLRGILGDGTMLLSSSADHIGAPTGLRVDRIKVLSMRPRSAVKLLHELDWSYSYAVNERGGSTTYSTPFLSQAVLLQTGAKRVVVPLGASDVEIRDADFRLVRKVPLPVTRRTFDRSIVERHRDSLIALIGDPASAAHARVARVFGTDFPTPERLQAVDDGVMIGKKAWLRLIGSGRGSAAEWLVIDPDADVMVGRVELPRSSRPLGGTDELVVVVERDGDGVETVAIYANPFRNPKRQ